MDRNTLLAFFLISLILIFTPKYMELVSPPPPESPDENIAENTPTQQIETETTRTTIKKPTKKKAPITTGEVFIFTLETPLYTTSISSLGGGSITTFKTKSFYTADSQYVDLILPGQKPNLFIDAKDLDGEPFDLLSGWKVASSLPEKYISKTTSITFQKELYESLFIRKTLHFNPDDYTINIDIDLSDVSAQVYRDIHFGWAGGLASTEDNKVDDYTYFKAYTYTGGELEELKTDPREAQKKEFSGESHWTAIRTKYFTASLIPSMPSDIRRSTLSTEPDSIEVYNSSFVFDSNTNPSFTLFLGPLEYGRIKAVNIGLDSIMDFGWPPFIRPISKGVLFMLKKMHEHIPNYGFVLIVFAFLVKLLVYPLTKKSYQSTTAMQAIQPEVNAIREKYKSNPTKMNQVTMALYKEKGVNPLGGCLPMLLQMPLLFALFVVFRTTIELRAEPFIWWVRDLSAPDVIINLPFSVPIYGAHVAALPILMVVSMFIQQKMMTGGVQQPQQKTMQYFMTAFFFLIFNSFPSGLNLYYTLFNILTIAQQKLVPTDTKTAS